MSVWLIAGLVVLWLVIAIPLGIAFGLSAEERPRHRRRRSSDRVPPRTTGR